MNSDKPPTQKNGTKTSDPSTANILCIIGSEALFVILPLIVLAIVFVSSGKSTLLFSSPEWSFASSIFIGLSIVKLISAVGFSDREIHWQRPAFVVAGLIVLGLVPSLIILSLMLTAQNPSRGLIITQISLFLVGVAAFFFIGGAGQYIFTEKEGD
jgi:hypothetical protein